MAVIPGVLASHVKPFDVSINKSFDVGKEQLHSTGRVFYSSYWNGACGQILHGQKIRSNIGIKD